MFTIDAKAFLASMVAGAQKLAANTKSALKRTSAAAATYARLSRLYKSHTYKLRESIQDHGLHNDFASRISANAKYARYVHDGTRAHPIHARRKKVLRFVQNGEVKFRKSVFHPGTKARPFMTEASKKAEPLFDRLCREAVDLMFG